MASRLSARAAQSDADRQLHEPLAAALRALDKASEYCGRVTRMRDNESFLSSGAARKYLQDIHRAQSLLQGIGTLVSRVDFSDPDLLPEETRAEIYRKKLADARKAKEEKRGR